MEPYGQYLLSCYNAVLNMLGNEIYPIGGLMTAIALFALVMGALINAHIFGTFISIFETYNRRAQKF